MHARSRRGSSLVTFDKQMGDRNSEAARQGVNHRESRVGLASLDAAHVGAEQTAPLGQILLSHALVCAQGADPGSEGALR